MTLCQLDIKLELDSVSPMCYNSDMNKTEYKAYRWLNEQGYKVRDIQHTTSPDFIMSDGKGYEIKLMNGNTIMFTEGQLQKLRKYPYDVDILVFRRDDDTPFKIFNMSDLSAGISIIDGIHIREISRRLNIPFSKEEMYMIKLASVYSNVTPVEWVRSAILDWVKTVAETGKLGELIATTKSKEEVNG